MHCRTKHNGVLESQEKIPDRPTDDIASISKGLSSASHPQAKKQILCAPLYNACVKGYEDVVRLLLDKDAGN